MAVSSLHPNLVVPQSKALFGLFTKLRDNNTSSKDFAFYARRAMRFVAKIEFSLEADWKTL
jgi:uracil phosphoribosyltransferase